MQLRPIIFLIILSLFVIGTASIAYSSTSPYDYSNIKTHQIIGSPDGVQSDYQVMLTVHRGPGTDYGQDVYLNGNSQSWPDDIRFVNINDDPLSYWIESYDTHTVTVWVKVDSIPAAPGTATIKLCYGKPGDASASNGDSTFILFDDFNDNSLDSSKWQFVSGDGSSGIRERNNAVEITGDGANRAYLRTKNKYAAPYAIDFKYQVVGGDQLDMDYHWDGILNGQWDMANKGYRVEWQWFSGDGSWFTTTLSLDGDSPHINGLTDTRPYYGDNGWHAYTINLDTGGAEVRQDGALMTSHSDTSLTSGYVGFTSRETIGINARVDDVRIRKYTRNEPTHGTWTDGPQTQSTMPTLPAIPTLPAQPPLQVYSYVKSQTIEGSPDGALSDYQLKFIVHRGSGTDNSRDMYLNGLSLSWPNDVRFTGSGGKLLNYWVESYDTNVATMWVKIDRIPAAPGRTTVNLNYGRQNDPGASCGTATFPFFDDFKGSALDHDKWSPSGSVSLSNGAVMITSNGTYSTISSLADFGPDYAIRTRMKSAHCGTDSYQEFLHFGGPDWYHGANIVFSHENPIMAGKLRTASGPEQYTSLKGWSAGTYHIVDLIRNGTGNVRVNVDDIYATASADDIYTGNENIGLEASHGSGSQITADWILVRQYTPHEPTQSPESRETPVVRPIPYDNYAFVKQHTINGSPDGALSDYQVKFIVHSGTGTDNGQDVYLNGHSQSWPNDIRFTNGADGLLSSWIEAYNANDAVVWVKVDKISMAPATTAINLYYGRPGDAGASSGKATFPFYEDWSAYSAGSNVSGQGGWTVQRLGGSGAATIQTDGGVNVLRIGSSTPDNSVITRNFSLRNDQAFRYRAKKLSGSDNLQFEACDGGFTPEGAMANGLDVVYGGYDHAYTMIRKYANGSESDIARVPDCTTDTNYHTYEWAWSGDSLSASRDGVELASGRDATWKSRSTIALSAYRSSAYCSYVLVRSFTLNEPMYGSWGAEKHITPTPARIQPSSYAFVKTHTIQGSTNGALTDYQIKFIVHRGSGTDNDQDVYLDGHAQSWPNDMRFTDNSGNILSYWVESSDTQTATVWVKVTSIPASPNRATIKLYYGKAGDPGSSNGSDTFEFFDDFNDGVLDNAKWGSPSSTTKVEEGDGVLKITAGAVNPGEITSRNYYTNGIIEARVTVSHSSSDTDHIILVARKNGPNEVQVTARGSPINDFYIYDGTFRAGPVPYEDLTAHMNQWHRFVFTLNGNSVKGSATNEATGVSRAISGTTAVTGAGGIGIGAHVRDDTVRADFIFLRKYTPNSPTHGTWNGKTSSEPVGRNWQLPGGLDLSTTDIAILFAITILMALIFIFLVVLGVLVLNASRK